jgi:phosphohistidine phosphatase
MRLVFFRHGIATDRDDPKGPPDAERPLTDKGVRRARAAAEGLRVLDVEPTRILTSPLLRARQTAELAAAALGVARTQVQIVTGLAPDDAPSAIFEVLARHADAESLLLVGHAPHLDRALRYALDRGDAPVTSLKKAGAACVELSKPGKPGGQLVWLLGPRALRALAQANDHERGE